MGFRLNLTSDEIKNAQGNFGPLPAGTYGAVIYSNKQGLSKSSNNPMFTIEYKIVEGPTGIGRKLPAWYVLTGKGLFKLVELNKATGFPYPDKNTPAGEFEFPDADEYIGIKVNIKVDQENYEGVASEWDVRNGTLNSETGDPVKAEQEPVTKSRNVVKNVYEYDEDRITTQEDLDAAADSDGDPFTL